MSVARPAAALAVLAACAALAPQAHAATSSQRFFRGLLLEDRGTSEEVVSLLRSRKAFVDRRVRFSDLTGDGRADAVVLVTTGGALGAVALYVFTTHGRSDGALRARFRRQSLIRVTARTARGRLVYRTARYSPGDDAGAPSQEVERTVRWSKSKRRFSEGAPRTIGEEPAPPAQGEDPPASARR